MIVYNKFVESKKEPLNKRDIWFDGKYTYLYKEGEWKAFTLPIESVDEIKEILQKENSILESKLLEYLKISDSPFEKGSGENSAVLKGGENISNNENEVAFGKYNKSNNNTIHSVGIGTSETNRKNAHEIMQNGKHYIYGVGGYDGTNPNDSKDLADIINNKAEIDNYYPDMSVGFADDLVGRGESVPAEFSFRASGGKSIKDGTAWVKRLRGNSVVWNQKIDKRYISQDSAITLRQGESLTTGHKYLLMRSQGGGNCYLLPAPDVYTYSLGDNQLSMIFTSEYSCTSEGVYPSYPHIYCTAESGYVQLIDLTSMFGAGNEPTTIEEFNARKPIVEDEFAYNEGEVIHMTAEGIKSVGDNAWDEEWELGAIDNNTGTITPSDSHIRSKNFTRVIPRETYYMQGIFTLIYYNSNREFVDWWSVGGSREFTIPSNVEYVKLYKEGVTYSNDIMITLVHSGWKQDTDAGYQPYWEDRLIFDQRIKEHFPNGMQKWDAVYNKNGKGYIVKGTGVVDLGELDWAREILNGYEMFRSDHNLLGATPISSNGTNLICARYVDGNKLIYTEGLDKSIEVNHGYYGGVASQDFLVVRDTSYTDVASFKAAMAGVLLYYQLAEPTIIEYDEPFNLDYRVADFGTEQMLTEQPSAPIAADIIYQFNAVDMIREHELEITKLQNIIAAMQEQLINLNNNI